MIRHTTLFDENIDRPKLTKQENPVEHIAPSSYYTPTKEESTYLQNFQRKRTKTNYHASFYALGRFRHTIMCKRDNYDWVWQLTSEKKGVGSTTLRSSSTLMTVGTPTFSHLKG